MKRFFHCLLDALENTLNYLPLGIPLAFIILGIMQLMDIGKLYPYVMVFIVVAFFIQQVINSFEDSK